MEIDLQSKCDVGMTEHLRDHLRRRIVQEGEAVRSVRRLAELDVETIVCYHGGVVGEDTNGQLQRVIQELSQEE